MKRKVLTLFIGALLAVSFASCNPAANPSSSAEPSSSSSENSSSEASNPLNDLQLQIFDTEAETFTASKLEAEDYRDDLLIAALNRHFAVDSNEQHFSIQINSITVNDDALTIDFALGSLPTVAMGSSQEESCLQSIARTFLEQYTDCNTVYFTVNGGSYSSGHFDFSPDEPFPVKAVK
jgi:hypothetical protein